MRTAAEVAADLWCIDNPIQCDDPHKRCVFPALPEGLTWDDIARARERIFQYTQQRQREATNGN